MTGALGFNPWPSSPDLPKVEVQEAPRANPANPANRPPQGDGEATQFCKFSRFSSADPAKLKNAHFESCDAEAATLAAHHATPADPQAYRPADADPLRDGLLLAAMKRPPAWAGPAAAPSIGAFCGCCNGRRWWGDALGWRCWTCRPVPLGVAIKEKRT
jgi:hypothetical protein